MKRIIAPAVVALLLVPSLARAIDFKIGKEPLRLDLTESMLLAAHLDDGNDKPDTKNYGELLNRLNAQLTWRKFVFQVRFDSGAWVHTPEVGDHSPYVSPPGASSPVDCPHAPANDFRCVIQPDDPRLDGRF